MKIKHLLLRRVIIVSLTLFLAGPIVAQTFTTLHHFSGNDGSAPFGRLLLSSNTLYGTAVNAGGSGSGTIFKINSDGTGFTNLHNFSALIGTNGISINQMLGTNAEGAEPNGSLILAGNTLYGTALLGGASGGGTVFAIHTDGTGFTNLHNFTALSGSAGAFETGANGDGATPAGGLVLSGSTLYGTAGFGGTLGYGTVFAVQTNGTGFTNLHNINDHPDGADPFNTLILSGNILYGTAANNGDGQGGTVFAININGTGFRIVHGFAISAGDFPDADMVLSGNTLFGMTQEGGTASRGTVFAVNTDSTGFTNLHSFALLSTNSSGVFTNNDGSESFFGLILSGDTLYGTAGSGGSAGSGTVFALNTNGTGFSILHTFSAFNNNSNNSDGYNPSGLILSSDTLYGTTLNGGSSGGGTIFSISFAPQLTISASAANVILTWPTNVAGFDYSGFNLQFTTNFISPSAWTNVFPGTVIVNGQNTVTDPVTSAEGFFRLCK